MQKGPEKKERTMIEWLENKTGIKKVGLQPLLNCWYLMQSTPHCSFTQLSTATEPTWKWETLALQWAKKEDPYLHGHFSSLPGEHTALVHQIMELQLHALSTTETLQHC